jgi:hypothetical protein
VSSKPLARVEGRPLDFPQHRQAGLGAEGNASPIDCGPPPGKEFAQVSIISPDTEDNDDHRTGQVRFAQ